MNNIEREGHLTSSQIYKLIKSGTRGKTFSAPAMTYIEEVNIERRMKRCLDIGAYSQPMAWGKFMELIIFSHLGLEYKILADESKEHPSKEFNGCWSGSADLVAKDKVGEIKCYQPKKFALFTDALLTKDIEIIKEEFPKEYWQVVSNAIIHGVRKAELITFMPYESEMEEIRQLARDYEGEDSWKFRFIYEKTNAELPVLVDGGYYKNINIFTFIIPEEDIEFLTMRVRLAKELLIKY